MITLSSVEDWLDMNRDYCPLCHSPLEIRDVAPCMECGHRPEEIEHALTGQHTYTEQRIFGTLTLILCDFCEADFGSFYPEFFGLPWNARTSFDKMDFVRSVDEVVIGKDKYCPECDYRLAFLEFVEKARCLHQQSE